MRPQFENTLERGNSPSSRSQDLPTPVHENKRANDPPHARHDTRSRPHQDEMCPPTPVPLHAPSQPSVGSTSHLLNSTDTPGDRARATTEPQEAVATTEISARPGAKIARRILCMAMGGWAGMEHDVGGYEQEGGEHCVDKLYCSR
ncbi:hypothetical protein BD410DRAFT_897766 [Rickenella mellea]|uniref:Uncharacterized protein n=1 Tax=Rickenella mellea TaxID=50990 RepID=A0A4Y7Q6R6_9AGAM|nr:hypothetical protein BD410DRAFT_897766 [Rickenella mellea]